MATSFVKELLYSLNHIVYTLTKQSSPFRASKLLPALASRIALGLEPSSITITLKNGVS
jgi:hypothetical protein